jgi:hypothetical protein
MNSILLQPADVLFFRDGRPMNAALTGHGAAWPLPNVINAAFHAALHRAGLAGVHEHRQGARGKYGENARRDRRFGSLLTAGPFPVGPDERWYFTRPADLQDETLTPALLPEKADWRNTSSLPEPLKYAASRRTTPGEGTPGEGTRPTSVAATDDSAKAWLSREAFAAYLRGDPGFPLTAHALNDVDFCDVEQSIGIGIDPITGTAGQGEAQGEIYTAHYLRLRENWRLGVCAQACDKKYAEHDGDLVKALLTDTGGRIIVGGQQRSCTARLQKSTLHLPCGRKTDFRARAGKFLVKWVLLSPAVWPAIEPDATRNITAHSGGWLPNWIDARTGKVWLKAGDTSRREYEPREVWRERIRRIQASIDAQLVAAIVPKPTVITGFALPDENNERETERNGGAQSSHLAVPAGAIYYFEANSPADAEKLANALNWHGATEGMEIKNRRSTLLGEKGFGLGVCGTWDFLNGGQ